MIKYKNKIDTKVTDEMLAEIMDFIKEDSRNKSDGLRIILAFGLQHIKKLNIEK